MTYLFRENSFDRYLRDQSADAKPDGLILYERCTHWPKYPQPVRTPTRASLPSPSIPRRSSGGGLS